MCIRDRYKSIWWFKAKLDKMKQKSSHIFSHALKSYVFLEWHEFPFLLRFQFHFYSAWAEEKKEGIEMFMKGILNGYVYQINRIFSWFRIFSIAKGFHCSFANSKLYSRLRLFLSYLVWVLLCKYVHVGAAYFKIR